MSSPKLAEQLRQAREEAARLRMRLEFSRVERKRVHEKLATVSNLLQAKTPGMIFTILYMIVYHVAKCLCLKDLFSLLYDTPTDLSVSLSLSLCTVLSRCLCVSLSAPLPLCLSASLPTQCEMC
jgi:hypothetical protein